MAETFAFELMRDKISKHNGDIAILLIDDDTASIASLTSMFQKLSYKVRSVNTASEAVSMIERQKDIAFVIANIEMPNIDSHQFHTSLLTKDLPFILINSEMKTDQSSNCLKERACYFLTKPISEKDISNMLQHVFSEKSKKLKTISMTKSEEDTMEEQKRQIEAFKENVKRQRTSQTSLLERRVFMKTFTAYEEYQKGRNVAIDEWKNKPVCHIEIDNKRKEEDQMESDAGERINLWTCERHMKFLSAIHTLGDKDSHPKTILKIMNDPNLTQQQVASHLQKYKAQVDQMNDTLSRNEWIKIAKTFGYPWEYTYPFEALSNIANNFILAEKPIEEEDTKIKFLLGGKMDLSNYSFFGLPSSAGSSSNTDLVLRETTYAVLGNVIPSEFNMEESQVQSDEGYDVQIEDMISFDKDINEMDMCYVLGNNGSSEENMLINTHIGHEAYNTPVEEENHVHGDNECSNWIDNVLNEEV